MRFDDRLLTVLNQPAEDRHDAAVRWRQLVDLVARAGANGDSQVVADALDAIRTEAHTVDERVRAAAARAVAALPLPLGLLEYFAAESLSVSAPVLAAVTLDAPQWQVLRSAADEETRRFIDTLHPEIEDEPQVETTEQVPAQASEPAYSVLTQTPGYTPPSLHEVVERIELRRRIRSGDPVSMPGAQSGQHESPALFRWECGPSGEIAWVEGAPRGPLIGRSLAKTQQVDDDRVDQAVVRAFSVRAPFRDGLLKLGGGGPVAGEWKISGVPAFDPGDGRFAGYRGVALREDPAAIASAAEPIPDLLTDPASLRELVHEIKTPLNAIMGFAQIIEGQYLGPADRGYRDRAAEIVRQARLLLTAIDDLDFAAKVHSVTGAARERVDLDALLDRAAGELREIAAQHGAAAEIVRARSEVPAAVQPELADRLLVRLFRAIAERARAGERIEVTADVALTGPRITITRPAAFLGLSESDLFEVARGDGRTEGGFSLRLARGLARIAGGDLLSTRDTFVLAFPRG